jgi:signal transduction histidine kinase
VDRDRLIALVVGLEMQLEVVLFARDAPSPALAHVAVLVLALGLWLRRRAPLATLVPVLVTYVVVQSQGSAYTDHLFVPLFVVLFMTGSAARHTEGRRFAAVAVLALVASVSGLLLDEYREQLPSDLIPALGVFVLAPVLGGRVVRDRARLQAALAAKAARLERDRAHEAERAALEERTRIAGDLHDIVAHALSGMVVQAAGAQRLAARGGAADLEQARAALRAVEGSGRDALAELRLLLGVLRREDEELALAPQPSLRHVDALVRRSAAAGLPAQLAVEGEAAELPAGVDVTAYRVVQEALTGARDRAAAGRATVRVRYTPDAVELEVRDDGAGGDPAPLGLRERVALYGGELRSARGRDGGHVVRARLPRERTA